jgi:drug/metabolite transporter (DMT)-like permease
VSSPSSTASPVRGEGLTWGLFALLSAIWGSSYLFIRIGLDEGVPPWTLVSLRALSGVLFLAVVVAMTGGRLPRTLTAWRRFAVLGLTQIAVPFALITWGQQHIASGLAGVLNALTPLFAVLLASLVLHDEPVTLARLAGLLAGFGGVVVLALPSLSGLGDGSAGALAVTGMAAVVVASLSYAVAAVYTRHRVQGRTLIRGADGIPRAPRTIEIAFAQLLVGSLVSTTLVVLFERPQGGLVALPSSGLAWLALLYLGILGTGVAYVLFFRIIAAWGATRATLVTYVLPVVAIALGFVFLGERLQPLELAGAALVIVGIVLVNARLGQRVLIGRPRP